MAYGFERACCHINDSFSFSPNSVPLLLLFHIRHTSKCTPSQLPIRIYLHPSSFPKHFQMCHKYLINQACLGPYWKNMGPCSFLYGPCCTLSLYCCFKDLLKTLSTCRYSLHGPGAWLIRHIIFNLK